MGSIVAIATICLVKLTVDIRFSSVLKYKSNGPFTLQMPIRTLIPVAV